MFVDCTRTLLPFSSIAAT